MFAGRTGGSLPKSSQKKKPSKFILLAKKLRRKFTIWQWDIGTSDDFNIDHIVIATPTPVNNVIAYFSLIISVFEIQFIKIKIKTNTWWSAFRELKIKKLMKTNTNK